MKTSSHGEKTNTTCLTMVMLCVIS